MRDAGLPHLGVHAMRHSAATIALDEGVALSVVQEMLGHSDIRVTRAFTHVFIASCRGRGKADGEGLVQFNCPENFPEVIMSKGPAFALVTT